MGRRKQFSCPVCGKILHPITGRFGEYYCDNLSCISNRNMGVGGYAEFYGVDQTAINQSSIHGNKETTEGKQP